MVPQRVGVVGPETHAAAGVIAWRACHGPPSATRIIRAMLLAIDIGNSNVTIGLVKVRIARRGAPRDDPAAGQRRRT